MTLNLNSIILNLVAAVVFAVFFLIFSSKNKTKREKILAVSLTTLFYFIALIIKDFLEQ